MRPPIEPGPSLTFLTPNEGGAQLARALPYSCQGARLAALGECVDYEPSALAALAAKAKLFSYDQLLARVTHDPIGLLDDVSLPALSARLETAFATLTASSQRGLLTLAQLPGTFDRALAIEILGELHDGSPGAPTVDRLLQEALDSGLVSCEHEVDGSKEPRFRCRRLCRCYARGLDADDPGASERYRAAIKPALERVALDLWLHLDAQALTSFAMLADAARGLRGRADSLGALAALVLELGEGGKTPAKERRSVLEDLDWPGLPTELGVLAHCRLVHVYTALGLIDEACAALETLDQQPLVESSRSVAEVGIARAQLAIVRGRHAEAVHVVQGVLASNSEVEPALKAGLLASLGAALMYTGRPTKAIETHRSAKLAAERAGHLAWAAVAEGNLGTAFVQSDPGVAKGYFQTARQDLRRVGDLHRLAVANINLARLDPPEAVDLLNEALDAYETLGHGRGVAIAASNLGELLHGQGPAQFTRALAIFNSGVEAAQASGSDIVGAVLQSQRGRLLLEMGRWWEARSDLVEAATTLRSHDEVLYWGLASASRAVCEALLGDVASAEALIQEAVAAVHSAQAHAIFPAMEAMAACVQLAVAANAALRGDDATSRSLRAAAVKRVDGADNRGEGTDVVIAGRLATQLLQLSPPVDTDAPETAWVVVSQGGQWCKVADVGADLTRRPTLARVLDALAEAWPEPLSSPVLFAQAWPEERALKRAQGDRVRAAIAGLRKLGLRDVIVRETRGYGICPKARLTRWPPSSESS